jgi:histidinol-phosphate aminotransferase
VDFAPGDCLELLGQYENVAVLRSLSKGYSLAGMRCGYLLGSRLIVDTLVKIKDSYNVNIATQVAAAAALEDQAWFRRNRDRIMFERERLIPALRELGFEVGASHTNFVLAAIREPSAAAIHEKLKAQNIYIRYFSQEPLTDKLRITVGTRGENDALLAALHGIIKG